MLKIHEVTTESGELSDIGLRLTQDGEAGLELVEAAGALPLPPTALEKVLARYGAPFDPQARITPVAELDLGGGRRLRHVRHLAGYDVVERDYLVLEMPDAETLCAPGATVAAALKHLALAARARR